MLVHAPAAVVDRRINPAVGIVEAIDDDRSILVTGADSLSTLSVSLGMLGVDFEVTEPPELVEHLRALATRYVRSTVAADAPEDDAP